MNWYKKAQLTIPPILYHATFKVHLESIQQRGLDPNFEGITKCWEDCENGIYLHVDPYVAMSYPETVDNPGVTDELYDSGIIVLEIDTTSLDQSLFVQDPNIQPPDDIDSFLYKGIIPFGNVRQIF